MDIPAHHPGPSQADRPTTDPAPTPPHHAQHGGSPARPPLDQLGTGTLPPPSRSARSLQARQVAAFLTIVFGLALAVALALPHSPFAPAVTVAIPLIGVALITAFATPRGERKTLWRSLGLGRAGLRSWPAAFLLPTVVLGAGYGTAALIGIAAFRHPSWLQPSWLYTAISQAINLTIATLFLLGEEIGWRGFLLPRLQTLLTPRRAAVVTGFIHGLFHLPLILLTTTYDTAGSRYVVAALVVATLTAAGVFYAWLRNRSGSIWPVAIAHATSNTVFALGAAAVATSTPAALAYTAGESGIATLICLTGCAIFLLSRASTLPRHTLIGPADHRNAQEGQP
jgi:membrane protease YdiL (CAAX protease family)